MRRFHRSGPGPLLLVSSLSVLALGSYILLRNVRKDFADVTLYPAGNEGITEDSETPEDQADGTDTDLSRQALPPNGTVLVRPETPCRVPFTLEVKSPGNHYIFLKYSGAPEKGIPAAASTQGAEECSDIGFFIKSGCSVTLNVPVGIYRLMYATGDSWRGLDAKFGSETEYYEAKEMLTFSTDGKYLYGNSMRLSERANGNSSYRRIEPYEFQG